MIDWGDGAVSVSDVLSDGVTLSVENGSGTAFANHVYANAGIYPVRVTVWDDDGGLAQAATTLFITGLRLTSDGVLEIVGTSGRDFEPPADLIDLALVEDLLLAEEEFWGKYLDESTV